MSTMSSTELAQHPHPTVKFFCKPALVVSSSTVVGVNDCVGTGFAFVKSAGNPLTHPTDKSNVDGSGFGGAGGGEGAGGWEGGGAGALGRTRQYI